MNFFKEWENIPFDYIRGWCYPQKILFFEKKTTLVFFKWFIYFLREKNWIAVFLWHFVLWPNCYYYSYHHSVSKQRRWRSKKSRIGILLDFYSEIFGSTYCCHRFLGGAIYGDFQEDFQKDIQNSKSIRIWKIFIFK